MTTAQRLDRADALELAFGRGPFLLFKHSSACPVSARAFRELELFLASHAVPHGWVAVIESRALSNAVAERTGIRHESPQAFVLEDGVVRWHASHGAITRASLTAAWDALGRDAQAPGSGASGSGR